MWKAAWGSGGGSPEPLCEKGPHSNPHSRDFYFLLLRQGGCTQWFPKTQHVQPHKTRKTSPQSLTRQVTLRELLPWNCGPWRHFASALKATWSMTHIPTKSQGQIRGPLNPSRWATPFPDNIIRRKYLLPKSSWASYKGFKIQVSMLVLFLGNWTPTVLGVILRRGPPHFAEGGSPGKQKEYFSWMLHLCSLSPHWWHRALWDQENELHFGNLLTSLHGPDRPQNTCHMFHP